MRIRVKLSLSKKVMEIIIKVEMGHNTIKTSYNYNIKEMRTKFQLRENGKYKEEDKNQKFHFGLKGCPSKTVGGEGESKEEEEKEEEGGVEEDQGMLS